MTHITKPRTENTLYVTATSLVTNIKIEYTFLMK